LRHKLAADPGKWALIPGGTNPDFLTDRIVALNRSRQGDQLLKGDGMSGMQDVHRYQAEQLARTHYAKLQASVACYVRRRLGHAAVHFPEHELEASYNMAWDALMERVAQGKTPECFDGWLCVVTYRRAVDYLRRRQIHREFPLATVDRVATSDDPYELAASGESVRQCLQGIERRFGERGTRIVAYLWLGDLTHAAAAERVGVSTKRLRKILYGHGRKIGLRKELACLLERHGEYADARAVGRSARRCG
jgi:DNA-directed RNA polymerase specialized sigma24 family protein